MLDLRRPMERGLIKNGSKKDEEAVQEILQHFDHAYRLETEK
jgi:hypothetical protein